MGTPHLTSGCRKPTTTPAHLLPTQMTAQREEDELGDWGESPLYPEDEAPVSQETDALAQQRFSSAIEVPSSSEDEGAIEVGCIDSFLFR